MAISTFQRCEIKFLLSAEQFGSLLPVVHQYMDPDPHCLDGKEYGIYNIYYDTPDDYLVRQSIDKPYYKEKLRLRSYDSPAVPQGRAFLEIKKKIGGIVTKRRVAMQLCEAESYMQSRTTPDYERFIDKQVIKELDFFLSLHDGMAPRQYISYQRAAFFGKEDKDFRLTFDREILERRVDLTLTKQSFGTPLIAPEQRLMEIKVSGALPLWMSQTLSELGIRKTSFSKYGLAYQRFIRNTLSEQKGGELRYA